MQLPIMYGGQHFWGRHFESLHVYGRTLYIHLSKLNSARFCFQLYDLESLLQKLGYPWNETLKNVSMYIKT
jgi:hypothetical protein